VSYAARGARFTSSARSSCPQTTVFCLFDGEEADVRAVSQKAGVPFERILDSLCIGGGGQPKQGR
jgi:hypothetical protein